MLNQKGTGGFFFASGSLLVFIWLISYESGVIIAFLVFYALFELITKKIKIDKITIFFVYGILVALLLDFIFCTANNNSPFITISSNLRFYHAVGYKGPDCQVTIPSANTNLMFYISGMFQYKLVSNIYNQGLQGFITDINELSLSTPSDYGIYFYFFIPIVAALLLMREKRSYFLIAWAIWA